MSVQKIYLVSSPTFDFQSIEIQEFIKEFKTGPMTIEALIKLYEKTRDFALYDPYHLDLRPCSLKASVIVNKKRAWCVEKATLMVASCRALGIPAKMGFATVINHLGSDKLEAYLKRKEITFHGYASIFWNNQWVRCTPAFDQRICRMTKVPVLEWDGKSDSLFQAESEEGRFMEYIHYYGEFDEIPFQLMHEEMKRYYPHLFEYRYDDKDFSFKYDTLFNNDN